jgi:N-acetylglucosaminyldiphosphoundecaprenol N-acetyl-beta-D-mannosaminyltransferase
MAALRSGDMNVPDTVGLWYAGLALHRRSIHRTPGADVTVSLCEEASQNGWRVYLLGAGAGVGLAAAAELLRRFPSLQVRADPGPLSVTADGSSNDTVAALERIRSYSPQLLFVALGAPKQELWLTQNRDALTGAGVRLAAGIGGSLDYLAGTMVRPPRLLRTLGLEWLGRLVQQPRRVKRIFRAIIVFPALVVRALLSGRSYPS